MTTRFATGLIALGLILLGGCHRGPTESDFKPAINRALADFGTQCLEFKMPRAVHIPVSPAPGRQYTDAGGEALVGQGWATVRTEKRMCQPFTNIPPAPCDRVLYEFTQAGRQKFPDGKFCYGPQVVTRITNWTEPANYMGEIVSTVSFEGRYQNMPDWLLAFAKDEALRDAFALPRDMDRPFNTTMGLVKTAKGWEPPPSIWGR